MRFLPHTVRSIVAVGALLVGLAVPAVLGVTSASASPARACAYDRPCIERFYYAPSTGRLNATWTANGLSYDYFNVRWTVNRGGKIVSFGQQDVGRRALAKLDVRQGDLNHPFTVSVQACAEHFLAASSCTPWVSSTRTPVPTS